MSEDLPVIQEEDDSGTLDQESLKEIMENLTDLEQKYCQIMVMQKPKSKTEALRRAGSKAATKYLSKMAWEIEQRPHVQAYMNHLRGIVVEELGLDLQEIVNTARQCIQIAIQNGKPRDAEPHNRLLAELGGFIRNGAAPTQQTQVNVHTDSALKGDALHQDIKKFEDILRG